MTYQAYGVVVELDGRVAHPVEGRWRDTRRANASAAADGQQTPGTDGRLPRCGRTGQLPA